MDDLSEDELVSFLRREGINLTPQEVRRIADILGRDPSLVELHIFNVEWSEHCSYKSSKKILKKYLPTKGPNVILGPGEDAGIVYLTTWKGERYGLVIAHESHNHPSQVLPVEGAATGIGGIVRDVDCMGAEVIAVADGLRFGNPEGKYRERTKWIASGVVQGIWEYANALGIPNIGGDLYFNESFDDNCLVNVVAIGIVKEKSILRSRIPEEAKNTPYDIILVGKPTDASGFGGAAFASEILDEKKEEEKKGAVQVHDPFLKNVLLLKKANYQIWREAEKRGYSIGMKDLGAAGICGSSSELGAASNIGIEIYLDKVHVALEGLLPEVILCSETQERYILAVPEEFTPEVLKIY
ncbi:phosphoribosylformylglycinamidine synthase, partial [Candidatus Calescamantes bacterium]|nr:phosphoribosylformylglycinamidine synthase [Candidatus Calescamantes bacterium]